jgi:tetratricopeptide (TPR) repeat protein
MNRCGKNRKPTVHRELSSARKWSFRIVTALLIPFLFFVSVEMALRLGGMGYPTAFVISSDANPGYFVDNYRFAWRFFPRALARSSQPLVVAQSRPSGTKRILVLGSSAAMGDPEPAYGLPRVLETLLEHRYPNQDFEVINAAVTAVNSHVVLPIARDCRRLQADAWVIYMGNNEVHGPYGAGTVFGGNRTPLWLIRSGLALRRTRIGQLFSGEWSTLGAVPKSWGGMTMFLDHRVRHDDPAMQRVYKHFAKNLADLVDTATAEGIPVVIGTVVGNLKDCGPFASLHGAGCSEAGLAQWRSHFDQGRSAQSAGRFDEAIVQYQKADRIDPEYAELPFRSAECYLALGQLPEAQRCFRRARDLDALRFRADSTINDLIRSVASERLDDGVHLIDATRELAERSPDGIVGDNFLYEHVHLNFAGNYLLAKLFAQKLAGVLQLEADGTLVEDWPSEQDCADRLGLTPFHQLVVLRELRTRLRSAPFSTQPHHDARLAKLDADITALNAAITARGARASIEQYRQLIEGDPDDWVLRKQFGLLLESTGDLDGAIDQLKRVTSKLPHHPDGFYRLGAMLNRAKKWQEAEQALRTALTLRPEYAGAANSLGIALSHQQRFEESYRQFRRAVELDPGYAEAYVNWGLVLANQNDIQSAVKQYHLALKADPDYLPAHLKLGEHFVAAGKYEQAEPHYSAAVRLKPNDAAARVNLGLLYLKRNQAAKAIQELQCAVDLDSNNHLARQALERARRMNSNK